MKELKTFSVWNGETKENDYTVERVSRWIKIQEAYNVTPRHSLYDYSSDEYGYNPQNDKFNPENGTSVYYFVWNGRKYALDQFIRFGSFMELGHYYGYVENGEKHYFSGYDSETIFNSMLIEIDEYCEHVRVYFEKH